MDLAAAVCIFLWLGHAFYKVLAVCGRMVATLAAAVIGRCNDGTIFEQIPKRACGG